MNSNSGCFIDIPFAWILDNCLDDVLSMDIYCTEIDYGLDATCSPFKFVYLGYYLNWYETEQYCQDEYQESLFCPSEADSLSFNITLSALMAIAAAEYDISEVPIGAWRYLSRFTGNDTDFGCYDVSYEWDPYLSKHSGYNNKTSAGGNEENCMSLIIGAGLDDVQCSESRFDAILCAQNVTNTIDPEKFNTQVSPSDMALIQECVLNQINPFVRINNLKIESEFHKLYDEFEVLSQNTMNNSSDDSTSFCIESLTAMMTVQPQFETEFGCEIEYSSELANQLPMYKISYQIY